VESVEATLRFSFCFVESVEATLRFSFCRQRSFDSSAIRLPITFGEPAAFRPLRQERVGFVGTFFHDTFYFFIEPYSLICGYMIPPRLLGSLGGLLPIGGKLFLKI
jgi:hypothetical protein